MTKVAFSTRWFHRPTCSCKTRGKIQQKQKHLVTPSLLTSVLNEKWNADETLIGADEAAMQARLLPILQRGVSTPHRQPTVSEPSVSIYLQDSDQAPLTSPRKPKVCQRGAPQQRAVSHTREKVMHIKIHPTDKRECQISDSSDVQDGSPCSAGWRRWCKTGSLSLKFLMERRKIKRHQSSADYIKKTKRLLQTDDIGTCLHNI